jgi:hypothetical protein
VLSFYHQLGFINIEFFRSIFDTIISILTSKPQFYEDINDKDIWRNLIEWLLINEEYIFYISDTKRIISFTNSSLIIIH